MSRLCVLAVLAVLLVSASACGTGFAEPQTAGRLIPVTEREAAPAFTGDLLDGGGFDSSALAGKIVFVNFWAQWCGPCRVESPALQATYAEHAADGVTVVGINVKDDKQQAAAFAADHELTYPIVYDPRSEVALAFDDLPLANLPVTVVLDRAGRIAAVYTSELSDADLTATVQQLLAEPA